MVTSPAERDDLVGRVMRRVGGRTFTRRDVANAVDRVLSGLAARATPERDATVTVIITAQSMPDLASRVRSAVRPAELGSCEVATEGRHTVLVTRVAPDMAASLREVAGRIGATVTQAPVA